MKIFEYPNVFSRLYLSDNLIADVGRGTFSAITRIGTIDLARNELQKIDYQMFAQLNYIEVSVNFLILSCVININLIEIFFKFQQIDLAENRIMEIQKQSFKDLYLTHINISYNVITKFEPNAFENCVNMTTLDLSHNLIHGFPRKTLDELSYTVELLLSYNNLTNISTVRNINSKVVLLHSDATKSATANISNFAMDLFLLLISLPKFLNFDH